VIGGCTGENSSIATSTIPPHVPLVGMQDGDTRKTYIRVFYGVDYLPVLVNERQWRAEKVQGGDTFWVPAEWAAVEATIQDVSEMVIVQIQVDSDGSPVIATANGRSVAYRPAKPDDPANDCY